MPAVFYSLRDASNPLEVARLRAQLGKLQAQAAELSKANEYGSILQREGAVGLNATTSHDSTKYFVSLPANKMELWFAMEAERFQVRGKRHKPRHGRNKALACKNDGRYCSSNLYIPERWCNMLILLGLVYFCRPQCSESCTQRRKWYLKSDACE